MKNKELELILFNLMSNIRQHASVLNNNNEKEAKKEQKLYWEKELCPSRLYFTLDFKDALIDFEINKN